jgi:hypothetical protein
MIPAAIAILVLDRTSWLMRDLIAR